MDRDAIPFNDRVVSFRHCHNGAETQFPLVVVDGSWKVEDWELRRNPVENWHVCDCATKLTPFSNGSSLLTAYRLQIRSYWTKRGFPDNRRPFRSTLRERCFC